MKNILFATVIFLSTISCSMAQTEFSKETLKSELLATDSQKVAFHTILDKHKEKTIVIEFWASWCSDCIKSMPNLKELQTNNPNVDFVFISLDKTTEKWLLGIEKHELKGDHYLVPDPEGMKGAFGKSINLGWIPRYIIIDQKGQIALFKAIETDFKKMQEVLTNLEK